MGGSRLFGTVAVVGGAGYVGSALVPYLLSLGYQVKVIDLFLFGREFFDRFMDSGCLCLAKVDMRDEEGMRRELRDVEAVIHLACISNDPSFELDSRLARSINYDAFFGFLRAARENKIKRLIYASSSSVYGVRDEPNVWEESECTPLTDYSKYKLLCEEALKSADLGDCEFVILRPATVCGYAPRMRLDLTVNILTISALTRKEIIVHGGGQLRPNINIQDMVEAYRVMLEAPGEKINGQTFNVGYENRPVMKIAQLVQDEIGDSRVTITVRPTDDRRSYHINSDKVKRVLGFEPRYSVRNAVRSIADAYHAGYISNPLNNVKYYNIKTMQQLHLV